MTSSNEIYAAGNEILFVFVLLHLMNTAAAATNKNVNKNGQQQQYAAGNDAYGEEQKAKFDLHSSY